MFFVELNEQEEVAEEDEIDKSIQEIHQSAQNLSDSIVHIAGASSSFKLSEDENFLISGDIPDKVNVELRSSTLKSTFTDYDTPPETPETQLESSSTDSVIYSNNEEFEIINGASSCSNINMDHNVIDVFEKIEEKEYLDDSPPVPPPRPKRKNKLKKLSLDGCNSIEEDSHQNDILFRTDSSTKLNKDNGCLKGYISVLTVTTVGLRSQWKQRWANYDSTKCKLKLYKNSDELELVGDIDVLSATFNYDLEGDKNGIFKICTKNDEQTTLDVGDSENRFFWLQQLQKARRQYNAYNSSQNSSKNAVGLLKSSNSEESSKESSPFKDILSTMERPPERELTSPQSADYIGKKSFFQNLTRKTSFKLVRSSSDQTPGPNVYIEAAKSPTSGVPNPGFQALSKLRKSIREKRPQLGPRRQQTVEEVTKELENVKDDLQATQDDASASKEVIAVLRKQIQTLQREKETLSAMKPELSEGQLLDILRDKDKALVEFESELREREKERELLEEKLTRQDQDVSSYLQLIDVKDQSIVKLTNQLDELELAVKIDKAASPPIVANGSSYFSTYVEKVAVGSQTDIDKDKEHLQDMVTAFQMQNKFLNKEVLELNQLRQQAIDREQKLFIEASDWEAKFYQIQSKYLLLLNELHNPQVKVSNSRQQMVGHLLRDIVESSEKPNLTCTTDPKYDRFGFKIDADGSLEEKAERLQRVAQENLEECMEDVESRWNNVVTILGKPAQFTVTMDVKKLIRGGIPINQRGLVWKAIVDNRIRGSMDRPQPDYYQDLLSNYNPGPTLTPAAKQIELDLLRTLPSNKHYDTPHASGISKLRRVLLAYSLHNPDIEYCQGFNRIAAIALLFLNEEDAFWLMVYIIDVVMPPQYYTKQLLGAQVDQAVFKELVSEKLPTLAEHLEIHGVDPSLFSLNWFLCLFVDTLPVSTYLHIWDAFLFEGSKVLFRYSLAILKMVEEKLLRQNDYMSLFSTFKTEVESLTDVKELTQIAFHLLNPFPLRAISNKREHHQKLIKAQMDNLEEIRRDYRKNSLATNIQTPCYIQSDEEEGTNSD